MMGDTAVMALLKRASQRGDVIETLVRPWPIDDVIECILSTLVSTQSLHFFVTYSTDASGRRHTQVATDSNVWEHLRRIQQKWSVSFFAEVPPERKFSPRYLISEAQGKGVAPRTARAIETACALGLDWYVSVHVLDEASPDFMPEVVAVLRRLGVLSALEDHLVDPPRVLRGVEALEAARRLVQNLV